MRLRRAAAPVFGAKAINASRLVTARRYPTQKESFRAFDHAAARGLFTERKITGYHAHVYFDAASLPRAVKLCQDAAARFPLQMGRVHERPVGPHPDWSCQLAFDGAAFADLVPWLALHRGGLVVFIHPLSGNALLDHREHAMWMGAVRPLDLSVLSDGDG